MNQKRVLFKPELQVLRGFAAITVVIGHLIFFRPYLDNSIATKGLYLTNGHYAVLIFFMLSGFVMGINYAGLKTTKETFRFYRNRLIRLYPIYLFSLALVWLVEPDLDPLIFIGNLFFLQGLLVEVIQVNYPAWSISYEVFYYLMFPVVSKNSKVLTVAFLFSFLGGCYIFIPELNYAIFSFLGGFVFWLIGLCSARFGLVEKKQLSAKKLIGLLLLIFCYPLVEPVVMAFNYFYQKTEAITVDFMDYLFLPSIIFFMLSFSGIRSRFKSLLMGYTFLLPALYFVYHIIQYHEIKTGVPMIALVFYVLSVLIYFTPDSKIEKPIFDKINSLFHWLGKASYAIYILHFPLIILIGYIPILQGEKYYFARILFHLTLTIGLSWILEVKLQPRLEKFFNNP